MTPHISRNNSGMEIAHSTVRAHVLTTFPSIPRIIYAFGIVHTLGYVKVVL